MKQASITPDSFRDINEIAAAVQILVDRGMAERLPDRKQEFQDLFDQVGDAAYGRLNTELFWPVRAMLGTAGLKATPRLPGRFQSSREWGNADESHQQRWSWSVVSKADGTAIGAIAVGSHHDHGRFHLPRSPEVIAVEATSEAAIIRELSARMPAFGEAQDFRTWYADYLAGQADRT
ncbi:DUF6022 family protein [uncultured Paracoccus sp.]|uniref:DUF6022 family protein n=1 Tax=uncultured Paracoccus sp. TaxID=189685 RepID=UPI002629E18B|nr:DUF6022 family protein [uncultured Paracoccus sp.]